MVGDDIGDNASARRREQDGASAATTAGRGTSRDGGLVGGSIVVVRPSISTSTSTSTCTCTSTCPCTNT